MTLNYDEYRAFIGNKRAAFGGANGLRGADMPARMFAHQRAATEFALDKGRAALFLDTGLGKSGCEVAFADAAARETRKPALILTPLAVARQMQREAEAFGIDAAVIREQADVKGQRVVIANYERIKHLDPDAFGAVVLDESSILKSFTGSTKQALVASFRNTPFRMAATATPAPNDHMEIGQHSDFLGVMPATQMLSRWFINDASTASQSWRLKGHAKEDFWRWVGTWARGATMPSDLGGDDSGFVLPPLKTKTHIVNVDQSDAPTDGMLFRLPEQSATSIHREKRITIGDRVATAARIANDADGPVIVWCETTAESTALAKAIPDAIEVYGSQTPEQKEEGLTGFSDGRYRVLVTKPKIAGFGMNWQHCSTVVFASISYSYEQYYQSVRRCWRFGQVNPVTAHIVFSETERDIWATVQRKARDHDRMKSAMAEAMRGGIDNHSFTSAYHRQKTFEFPAWLMESANAQR
jgi:superfamily II DNA or RNA helicase